MRASVTRATRPVVSFSMRCEPRHVPIPAADDGALGPFEQALEWLADGVALLGADGRVVYANCAFRAIAQRDGGIATRDMAGRGAFDFSVARSGGAAPYLFSVRPLAENMCAARPQSQAVAAVFIRDPSSRNTAGPRILCDVLQLTEAEVLLAQALQAGVRLKDHARARGISINTIYAHLRSIKQKTGCHRMGELIRRLNDLQAAARSDRADDG
jgi:DNA-binding CsgD family transcriptional regulator